MSQDFDDEVWDDYDRYQHTGECADFFTDEEEETLSEEDAEAEDNTEPRTIGELIDEMEVEHRRKLLKRQMNHRLSLQQDWQKRQAQAKAAEQARLKAEEETSALD